MIERQPSLTAFAAARYRAAHQLVDGGRIFADPFALAILGEGAADAEALRGEDAADPSGRMRRFIALRSALAESRLLEGVAQRGVSQLVVLGAGLDTFAYRNPVVDRLRVFEVDHPATQAWKRRRLREAGIAIPDGLAFAPVDFERENLMERLVASGFEPRLRSYFTWLGVVPYLTRDAIEATLRAVGSLAGGSEIAFDYADPPHTLPPELRAASEARAARVAAIGEPFLSAFEPHDLHALLAAHGFASIDDFGPRALFERIAGTPAPAPMPDRGGHVLLAATA